MKIDKYFIEAVKIALLHDTNKRWMHAAIGIRKDGAIVYARNGGQNIAISERTPKLAHAEARLCRKLDKGAPLVIVVRVDSQGRMKMSKPCKACQQVLKNKKVRRVMWSANSSDYDQMIF